MKAIKNQIDPHLTLNILNAIGSLCATENDRKKADYVFGKYARLFRKTFISSDQIIITLAEDLDFVKNYIDFERLRCNNVFNYTIEVGEVVDMQVKVPRMLIHTFVENALKYGVRCKSEGGLIKIALQKSDNKCRIAIEDNGSGMGINETFVLGTGNGLQIVIELIDLYFKLGKSRITYNLENIPGPRNAVRGTKVIIQLPL